jgi:hypothetical protein
MNRKVKALLDRRSDQVFPDNEDLLVDMYSAPLWILARFLLVKSATKGLNVLYNPFRERTPYNPRNFMTVVPQD